jgi:hypothetical protein
MTVGRRKLNSEDHHLYSSPSIIGISKSKRVRWVGHVARMKEIRNQNKISFGRPEWKVPLGRHRLKWEDNIKMDLM